MIESRTMPKLLVRLPVDVKSWLRKEADRNATSQSSEVVRALRDKLERHSQESEGQCQ